MPRITIGMARQQGTKKKGKNKVLITFWTSSEVLGNLNGGAEEDRTPDLRIANATLSQLSYRPMSLICGWLNSAPNRAHILTSAWDNRYPDQRPSRGFLLSSSRSSSRRNFCRSWR